MKQNEEDSPDNDSDGVDSESEASSDTTATSARATLTEGPVARVLAGLAGPMVIGMFSVIAFNLTDTYFIARPRYP